MDDTNSLIEQRKAKLTALRAKGIDPFKNKFTPGETCKQARDHYTEGREVAVAGRITAHREMGKSMFIDVRDQSGRIQVYAQKNALGDELWNVFTHLDLGDFVGVRGALFTTKTGEISIKLGGPGVSGSAGASPANERASREQSEPPFVILAKALRPPPAKWHGLEDTEIRYRQRYLDLMANPEVKEIFLKRSEIIREIRNFLHSRGFIEVETPMMQAIPGGAAAQPFKTHHNALGCDFYLRIALELYLKRLLVGGVDKVFEIGRNFRNEGLSRKHNPEFTMLEAYQAFGDYESMMELVESMVKHVAQKVLGTLSVKRSRQVNIKNTIDELIRRLEELSKNAIDLSAEHEVRKLVANDLRKSLAPIVSRLSELRLNLTEDSIDTVGAEIKKLLTQAEIHVTSAMATALPIENENDFTSVEAVISFTNNWDDSFRTVKDSLHSGLKRLEVELANPTIELGNWKRAKYKDLICEVAGKDWFNLAPSGRLERGHFLGAEITKDYADFEVTGAVFEKLIEPTLIQPTFVTHLPKELVPLAKLSPDDPTTVEVFECCINGQEIAPAYTEQNDPIEQRERLEHQAGGEQQKLDEDFLVALEHGMPPAGGMGMGIDRLCMMLLGQESIRDVILFPQLKPRPDI
jgi:lysyl-tRNA synthetase class 2